MNGRLIFLDIDGTLTVPVSRVPRSARAACAGARRAGNRLFICTGRAMAQIPPRILRIGFDGVVCSGGAQIYVGGALIHSVFFDAATLDGLTRFLDSRRVAYVYECPDGIVPGPYLGSFYDGMARTGLRGFLTAAAARRFWRRIEVDAAGHRDRVCKVVFVGHAADNVLGDLRRERGDALELFANSIPGMFGGEISPRGVHKGAAMEIVAARLGVDRVNVFAFGDGDNDRTMIAAAGHGVAMGNAPESLKAVASDVTDRVERNGLWKAFQKYGLMEV